MYNKVLSEIHDRWFSTIAENAADHIEIIANSLAPYKIVDLGCGSGVLLNRVKRNCEKIYGFDISSEMIAKCKKLIPDGYFKTSDVLDVDIPKSNVVVMVGEILSYATNGDEYDSKKVKKFLSNIFHSLSENGVFLFDVLGNNYDYSGNFVHDHQEYTIFSKIRNENGIVIREIFSFLKDGQNYQKSVELHRLRTFDENQLITQLREVGFNVKRITSYSQEPILPGRIAFECRKNA